MLFIEITIHVKYKDYIQNSENVLQNNKLNSLKKAFHGRI